MDADIGDALDMEDEDDDESSEYESAEDEVIEIKNVQKFDDNDRKCASFVNKIQLDVKESIPSEDFVDLGGAGDFEDTASVASYGGVSCFSTSTTSTIHPDVIKSRVKTDLKKREKQQSRMSKVKGEASAATRSRRNNRDTIKDSVDSIDIWG